MSAGSISLNPHRKCDTPPSPCCVMHDALERERKGFKSKRTAPLRNLEEGGVDGADKRRVETSAKKKIENCLSGTSIGKGGKDSGMNLSSPKGSRHQHPVEADSGRKERGRAVQLRDRAELQSDDVHELSGRDRQTIHACCERCAKSTHTSSYDARETNVQHTNTIPSKRGEVGGSDTRRTE